MKANFFQKTAAAVIDAAIIGAGVVILPRLLSFIFPPQRWVYAMLLLFLYFSLCYILKGRTVGQALAGIRVVQKDGRRRSTFNILLRETLKVILLLALPLFLYFLSEWFTINHLRMFMIIIVYLGLLLLSGLVFRRFLWSQICRTRKVKASEGPCKRTWAWAAPLACGLFLYLFLMVYNNIGNPGDTKICGYNYPFKFLERPYGKKVKPYADFLDSVQQSPKEYVLSLFEKYDMVVLEEGTHDAIPEWDLIYDIVTDDYFVKNVGTIFTEYGDYLFQNDMDTLLRTRFESDEALSRAIPKAMWLRPYGYCFYNFLKKLNLFNQGLDDSLKIRLCPNDINRGKYFTTLNYLEEPYYSEALNVDSLRAQYTIDWYCKHQRKCLIITNTYHSFIVSEQIREKYPELYEKYHRYSQCQFIYNRFPGKIANVKYYKNVPISEEPVQRGIWDAAFRETGSRKVGFDLKGTPFGSALFDSYAIQFIKSKRLTYDKVYTGIVFDAQCNTYYNRRPAPYIKEAIRELYDRQIANGSIREGELLNTHNNWGNTKPDKTIEELLKFYDGLEKQTKYKFATEFLTVSAWHYADIYLELLWLFLAFLLCIGYAIADGIHGRKRKRAAIPAESRSNTETL